MKSVPVLIAGGGPVGMTLACELSRRGIECMLVERNATTTRYPKMDITNARSMELFRRLALVNALRSVAVPEDNNFDVSWVTSLTGHELHRFRYPSVNEWRRLIRKNNDGSMPGEAPMRVSQVEIEPVLQGAVKALPGVEARWDMAFEELRQDAEGVTATRQLPQPRQPDQWCPVGWMASGNYCVPGSDKAPAAIPKNGWCPAGWRESGSYCIR